MSCTPCDIKFEKEEDWKTHLSEVHTVKVVTVKLRANKPIKCEECIETFESGSKLFLHHILVHKGKLHEENNCDYCLLKFKTNDELMAHWELDNSTSMKQNKVVRKTSIKTHIDDKRYFECRPCKLVFRDPEDIKRHSLMKHGETQMPEILEKIREHSEPKHENKRGDKIMNFSINPEKEEKKIAENTKNLNLELKVNNGGQNANIEMNSGTWALAVLKPGGINSLQKYKTYHNTYTDSTQVKQEMTAEIKDINKNIEKSKNRIPVANLFDIEVKQNKTYHKGKLIVHFTSAKKKLQIQGSSKFVEILVDGFLMPYLNDLVQNNSGNIPRLNMAILKKYETNPLNKTVNKSKAEAETKIPCTHCDYKAKSASGLKTHITRMHRNQGEMEKKVLQAALSSQIKKGGKGKEYNCDNCGFNTKVFDVMIVHLDIHIDKGRRSLDIGNNKEVLSNKTENEKEAKTFEVTKPMYRCNTCGIEEWKETNLKNHICCDIRKLEDIPGEEKGLGNRKRKTPEQAQKLTKMCDVCHMKVEDIKALKRHMRDIHQDPTISTSPPKKKLDKKKTQEDDETIGEDLEKRLRILKGDVSSDDPIFEVEEKDVDRSNVFLGAKLNSKDATIFEVQSPMKIPITEPEKRKEYDESSEDIKKKKIKVFEQLDTVLETEEEALEGVEDPGAIKTKLFEMIKSETMLKDQYEKLHQENNETKARFQKVSIQHQNLQKVHEIQMLFDKSKIENLTKQNKAYQEHLEQATFSKEILNSRLKTTEKLLETEKLLQKESAKPTQVKKNKANAQNQETDIDESETETEDEQNEPMNLGCCRTAIIHREEALQLAALARQGSRRTSPQSEADMKFKCNFCDFKTDAERKLRGHMTKHKFKCNNCPFESNRKDMLDDHMERHMDLNTNDEIKCYTCKISFQNRQLMKSHYNNVHKSSIPIIVQIFKCESCDFIFINEGKLKVHTDAVHQRQIIDKRKNIPCRNLQKYNFCPFVSFCHYNHDLQEDQEQPQADWSEAQGDQQGDQEVDQGAQGDQQSRQEARQGAQGGQQVAKEALQRLQEGQQSTQENRQGAQEGPQGAQEVRQRAQGAHQGAQVGHQEWQEVGQGGFRREQGRGAHGSQGASHWASRRYQGGQEAPGGGHLGRQGPGGQGDLRRQQGVLRKSRTQCRNQNSCPFLETNSCLFTHYEFEEEYNYSQHYYPHKTNIHTNQTNNNTNQTNNNTNQTNISQIPHAEGCLNANWTESDFPNLGMSDLEWM